MIQLHVHGTRMMPGSNSRSIRIHAIDLYMGGTGLLLAPATRTSLWTYTHLGIQVAHLLWACSSAAQ